MSWQAAKACWRRCAAERAAPPAYAPVWAGTKNALRDPLGAFCLQFYPEPDAAPFQLCGGDASAVPLCNAFRNGKPHPKAAAVGSGRVSPVEAVKQAGKGKAVHCLAAVVHREDRVPFPREPHLDGPLWIAVLYGVVQQDGDKLPQGALIPFPKQGRGGLPR